MTDFFGTRVENPSGTTHTGSGDIHISMGPQPHDVGRPAFRRMADDQLGWLRRVLVAPENMGQARSVLADTGTVIVDGSPGSGRTSAARVLLREYHHDTGVLHELLPEEEDELPLHDPDLVGAGDQLLLDLSAADAHRWSRTQAALSALRKTVHDRQAHLVVVMPHDGSLDSDLQNYRVQIRHPQALNVLKRHLRMHGLPCEEYLQPDVTVTEFLQERPMREIAAFADLVRRARETEPDKGFAHWCAQAYKARDDRRGDIADLAIKLREAPQRALLVTVAMVHGAHSDVVHRAAHLLLRVVGSPPGELSLLEHKDLSERLREIEATSDPRGHVRFKELDYDAAVRAHFWDHVPDLRPHLGAWVAQLVDLNDPHMNATVRDELVARLAEQYLRTVWADGLVSLAEGWSSASTSQARLEAAVHALACGLNHPVQGGHLRNLIYRWCADRRLKGEFGQVLIRVCADVLASSHPDQALIRLYHLARRERGSTRALQTLSELVAGSRRLRRRLLDRLARSNLSPADLAIFLDTCRPGPLTESGAASRALLEENGVQRSLTICWHAVLASLPRTAWHPHAERWLHQAAADPERCGELLLDIIVDAAERCDGRRGTVFASLYASARDAERTAPGAPEQSAAITELLLTKISAAQGLGPTTSATASAGGNRP